MATKSPELFLSPDQRALLLAALNSNTPLSSQPRTSSGSPSSNIHRRSDSGPFSSHSTPTLADSNMDNSLFSDIDAFGDIDYSNNFDLGLPDNLNFDFDNEDTPGDHEKRKLSIDDEDEEDDPHETEPKRREGDDKTAKKPGRKPIVNEPTSKRKAQNRAAQRAFRERKEKHLKDLEQKVTDLEKISESTTQENKALKDQVDKLQTELKEYRKRFSLGGSAVNRSPSNSVSANLGTSSYDPLGSTGGFNFDFPLFGNFARPGQNIIQGDSKNNSQTSSGSGSVSPANYKVSPGGILEIDRNPRASFASISPRGSNNNSPSMSRHGSSFVNNTNQSPVQVHRVSVEEPRFNPSADILSDLFSPSILQAVNNDSTADYMNRGTGTSSVNSTPHMSSLFSFSDSPSASSVSRESMKNGNNNTSSCGTTPEAMDQNSPPANKLTDSGSRLNSISEEGEQIAQQKRGSETELSFCEKLAKACGNSSNPVPAVKNETMDSSFQWLAAQNGGNFEPLLFNDYRDPADQFSGVGMSYFDDAFPSAFDLGLPPTPAPTKPQAPGLYTNEDEDEEVVPAEDTKSLLKCNQIWDKVQKHPKFASGEIDMDNLCSELRAKAKCSESGVVVNKKDVDKILGESQTMPSMWTL